MKHFAVGPDCSDEEWAKGVNASLTSIREWKKLNTQSARDDLFAAREYYALMIRCYERAIPDYKRLLAELNGELS